MSLSRRASLRNLFRSRSRANLSPGLDRDLADADLAAAPPAPPPRPAYVPVNAASGFSRTVKPPRAMPSRLQLPPTREEPPAADSGSGSGSASASDGEYYPPPRLLVQPGHLYLRLPPDMMMGAQDAHAPAALPPPADDYETFIAAARAYDRARMSLVVGDLDGPHSPMSSREAPDAAADDDDDVVITSSPGLAGRKLRNRRSLLMVGRRIAQYVKPEARSPASPTYSAR